MTKLPSAAQRIRSYRAPHDQHEAPREWYRILNAVDSKPAEILIYDEIDPFWGVSANQFVRDLAAIDADAITVRINSPGGDVYEGIAILNALRSAKQTITTVIDGIAASAASFIAMAGDDIAMMPNSELMIHDPWALAIGNAADMSTTAANLDRIGDNLASIYAARAGGTQDEWRAAMRDEIWYSAQEAVDAGLADRIVNTDADSSPVAARLTSRNFDLSMFAHAGRANAPAPQISSATAEAGVPKNKEVPIVATLNDGVIERLGLNADADDDTILEALDEALAEQASEPAEPSVEQAQQIAAKHGLSVIDSDQLALLTDDASAGREARNILQRETESGIVDKAIDEGRIPPSRRDHWLNQIAADPNGIGQLVAQLPQVIPLDEKGYNLSPQNGANPGADDTYTKLFGPEA